MAVPSGKALESKHRAAGSAGARREEPPFLRRPLKLLIMHILTI
jgi:hypothetical protein